MKKLCNIVLLALLVAGCKVQYAVPSQAFPRVELSEGGGFTGAVATWFVLKNGQVFYQAPGSPAPAAMGEGLPKKDAGRYIRTVKSAVNIPEPVMQPDNIYRVLRYVEKDTFYEAVWYNGHPELDSIYNSIKSHIERSNEARE